MSVLAPVYLVGRATMPIVTIQVARQGIEN